MTGVSLVVEEPKPVPPPTKTYVLTLDEEHAEFLYSLLRRVQVVYEAGRLSYDIFLVLSKGNVPYKSVAFRHIASLGGIEVRYDEDDE